MTTRRKRKQDTGEIDPKLLSLPTAVHGMLSWYTHQCKGNTILLDGQTRLDNRSKRLERLGLIETQVVKGKGIAVHLTDLGDAVATTLRLGGNLTPGGDDD
jgi:hypothetical protein